MNYPVKTQCFATSHCKLKISFQSYLLNNNPLNIHQRNLKSLATEICNVQPDIAAKVMNKGIQVLLMFYNLRAGAMFKTNVAKTHTQIIN